MHDEETAASPLVREHDIGPRGSVVVAVGSNDLRVRGVDGTLVRLVAPASDDAAIEVVTGPGSYGIHLGRTIRGRGFGFRLGGIGLFGLDVGGGTVELEVPRDARLEVSASSGDVTIRDLTGSVAVRTASGDISFRGAGGDLHVEAASGNLRAVAASPIALSIRTFSGDVEIDAPRAERTSITTVSGDIEIASAFAPGGEHVINTTSGDVELAVTGGLTIEVRTVSGDVDCAHPDRRAGNGRREPLVIGDGAARLAVRTLSGDIDVRAGRIRADRIVPPGAQVPMGPPMSAVPPLPAVPPMPGEPPLPAVPPLPGEPPLPAVPPLHGEPPPAPVSPIATASFGGDAGTSPDPAETLSILEALARGEIDVAEAERRLAGGDPTGE